MCYRGLVEVWSGGQIGADIAGLRAARRLDLRTGGWIPHGFRTHDGSRPDYAAAFGLVETESSSYPARTKANVRDTDATLILGDNPESSGCALTRHACEQYRKPFLALSLPEMKVFRTAEIAAQWLRTHQVRRLNIAGNRDAPEETIELWLLQVFLIARAIWDED